MNDRCAFCGKKVNPVLAPVHVITQDGRIVPLCSDECRSGYLSAARPPVRRWALAGIVLSIISAAGVVLSLTSLSFHTTEETSVHITVNPFFIPELPTVSVSRRNPEQDKERFVRNHLSLARKVILEEHAFSPFLVPALESLARAGDTEALKRLHSLMDGSSSCSFDAAQALAALGDGAGIAYLRKRLRSPGNYRSPEAALALARAGDRSVSRHITVLMGFRPTRWAAAEAGTLMGLPQAKEMLLRRAFGAKRVGDRIRAAEIIARTGDGRVKEVLAQGLESGVLRLRAALGLAWLGDARALPVLERALAHAPVRIRAARAIRSISSSPPVYDSIVKAMDSPSGSERLTGAAAFLILYGGERNGQ